MPLKSVPTTTVAFGLLGLRETQLGVDFFWPMVEFVLESEAGAVALLVRRDN
jgi:hypothetical protein